MRSTSGALGGIDPNRYFGPFLRCIDVLVPEWYELLAVPDVSICVTQALTGGVQTIYDGAFDIDWGTNPIPSVTLHASPIAIASQVPCPPPQVNPDELGFQYVGLLPVSPRTRREARSTVRPDSRRGSISPDREPAAGRLHLRPDRSHRRAVVSGDRALLR